MTAIKPRTATVVIYQGDDLARLAELDEAVTKAEVAKIRAERAANEAARRVATLDEAMTEQDALTTAQEAFNLAKAERDEFAAEAEVQGVAVVLHAQPRKKWRDLMDEHGPREDVKDDEALGVNMKTLPDALLPQSICRDSGCPVCRDRDQKSTIEGDTDEFLESLGDYDYYDRLFLQAFALNRGSAMADPTQRLGSAPSPILPATSN